MRNIIFFNKKKKFKKHEILNCPKFIHFLKFWKKMRINGKMNDKRFTPNWNKNAKDYRTEQDLNLRGLSPKGFQVLLLDHSDICASYLQVNSGYILYLQNKNSKKNLTKNGCGKSENAKSGVKLSLFESKRSHFCQKKMWNKKI